MPTGFTSKLYEGEEQTFEEFVQSCAHAFVSYDVDINSPLRVLDADEGYTSRQLADAITRRALVLSWTTTQAAAEARKEYKANVKRYKESITEEKSRLVRYKDMLGQVKAWTPPTERHEKLKSFMIEQLESSIGHDTSFEWWESRLRDLRQQSGTEYKQEQLSKANADIEHYTQELRQERERLEKRNSYVTALLDSLHGVNA